MQFLFLFGVFFQKEITLPNRNFSSKTSVFVTTNTRKLAFLLLLSRCAMSDNDGKTGEIVKSQYAEIDESAGRKTLPAFCSQDWASFGDKAALIDGISAFKSSVNRKPYNLHSLHVMLVALRSQDYYCKNRRSQIL